MQHRDAAPIDPQFPNPLLHDRRAQQRASQALRCLPFRLEFYNTVAEQALSSNELCRRNDSRSLCRGAPTPDRVEAHWIWLIQLGVLRREVDGQGLTERVRLTPLGRDVLAIWSDAIPAAGPLLRLRGWLRRHRPRL
jgi:hypothetical protein